MKMIDGNDFDNISFRNRKYNNMIQNENYQLFMFIGRQ